MDIVTLVLFLLFMPALYFFVLNLGSGSLEGCPDCGEENPNDAEECETCGFNSRRPSDSKVPLVLHWADNTKIFKDQGYAFRVTFLNKCDDIEKKIIAEYFQRCFGEDLPESSVNASIS